MSSQEYDKNAIIHESVVVIANTTPGAFEKGGLVNLGGLSARNTYVSEYLNINDVNITPNKNDIIKEIYYDSSKLQISTEFLDIGSLENSDLLYFKNSNTSSFTAQIYVKTKTESSMYQIRGMKKSNNWLILSSFTGDNTGIKFNIKNETITLLGQETEVGILQYKNSNHQELQFNVRVKTNSTTVVNENNIGNIKNKGGFLVNKLVFSSDNSTLTSSDLYYDENSGISTFGNIELTGEDFVLPIVNKDEVNGTIGQIILDTNDNYFKFYNNTGWSELKTWEIDNESGLFYTVGNVGIGTTDPETHLHVAGTSKMTRLQTTSVSSGSIDTNLANISGDVYGNNMELSSNLNLSQNLLPTQPVSFDLGSSTNKFREVYVSSNSIQLGSQTLSIGDSGLQLDNIKSSDDFTAEKNFVVTGKLGINTTSPQSELDVSGSVYISKNLDIAGNVSFNGTTTYVNTETLNINDNVLTVGYNLSEPKDTGVLFTRHINSIITDEIVTTGSLINTGTNSSIPRPSGLTGNYRGYWIDVKNGETDLGSAQIDNTSGNFTFYTAGNTLSANIPVGSTLNFYNKSNSGIYFDEPDKKLVFGYVADIEDPKIDLDNNTEFVELQLNNLNIKGDLDISDKLNVQNGVLNTDENGKIGINKNDQNYDLDIGGNCNVSGQIICDNLTGENIQISQDTKINNETNLRGNIIFGDRDDLFQLPNTRSVSTVCNVTGIVNGDFSSAVLTENGKIYCSPSNGQFVIEFDPDTETYTTFGSTTGGYLGGISHPNGKIYCMPDTANSVLEIDPEAKTVFTFGNATGYLGGVLHPNGKIYGIPWVNANSVLEIDPETRNVSTFGNVSSRFWGGALAPNGKIYSIPYNSNSILEINPDTKSVNFISSDSNGYLGTVLAPNGKIYGIPRNTQQVLEFDPHTGQQKLFGDQVSGYYGGILAPNGKIYAIPRFANSVLEIDPDTHVVSTFGNTSSGEWSSGILAPNGNIYSPPFVNSTKFLKIALPKHPIEQWMLSAYVNKL